QVCHVTHSIHFFVLTPRPSCSSLFPYTTLFRSLDLMYSTSLQMVNDVFNGFIAEDTKLAAKVFKLDETLNSINRNASSTVTELIQKDPGQAQNYLYLLSIIRKLERVGDLTKNIAEEFIFYIEAKVLK